ncbi:CHY zinc finger domain-containing protein [Vairimorpha necatrix]|uniref:CHY zinc finger domain-containing protein n=1 Tax=Vairimorpha necatrix TaxID=6039 RepID=A0AAX4J8F5_9MICR
MGNFTKTNRTIKKDNCYLIYLNIPKDCIYEVSNIIIEFNLEENEIKILSDDIPDEIKSRMASFYCGDIDKFIRKIEENLDIFLSGKEPEKDPHVQNIENEDKIISLPDKFVYPTQNVNINTLEIEISKKGIYFFIAKNINIQVNCKKCKKSSDLVNSKKCTCGNLLKCNFIPTLNSEVLGSLFLDNCTFLHLNPTNFQFNCENCFSNYQSNKIGINTKFRMDCWKCNNLLSFNLKKLIFVEKKTQTFKIGSELPQKGACKHYKRSYRWFRFPCCKSVYPCDICHDAENNHQSQFANKMICGFCSKEQSVKSNCDCGMDLKKSTTFWEGGKGSRNKATMSKKDSKKYTK